MPTHISWIKRLLKILNPQTIQICYYDLKKVTFLFPLKCLLIYVYEMFYPITTKTIRRDNFLKQQYIQFYLKCLIINLSAVNSVFLFHVLPNYKILTNSNIGLIQIIFFLAILRYCLCSHVVCVLMLSVFSCCPCSHVVCVLMLSVFSCRLCSHVVCVLMSSVFSCRLCSHVVCVLMSSVFSCRLCSHVACVHMESFSRDITQH